jgi:2-phospho-L-lactate guanylyltransferase
MDAGILPVKRPDRAKQRLADALSDDDRLAVTRALLHDAFELCASADDYSWWVVSDDPDVLTEAKSRGFAAVVDPGRGLNDALEAAIAVAIEAGATSVTVIPADVPLAWKGDLQDIADTGATSDVVVVPSRDGGTNALYLSPGDVMPPLFGEASLKAHIESAERLGKRCTILALPRLELDIDTVADIDAYLERPKAAETRSSVVLARVRAG